jgi:hypothetical protein
VTIKAIYPYNPLSTSRIRSYRTLQVLARMARVDAYFPNPGYDDRDLDIPAGVTMHVVGDDRTARMWRFLRAVLSGGSLSYAYYKSLIREATRGGAGSLVFVERLPLLADAGVPVVYDAVDCFSGQVRSLAGDARGLRKPGYIYDRFVIGREQVRYCNRATLTLCTTETEGALLARDGAKGPMQTFLHRSQVDSPAPDPAPPVGAARNSGPGLKTASFHGRASYPANAAAVRFLERLSGELSGSTEIVVFGHGWKNRSGPGFRMLGRQPDLRILQQADFGVFPMATAVGIPNKVMECLAHGLPVILSPVIAERLPPEILEEFSARVIVAEIGDFKETVRRVGPGLSRSTDAEQRFRIRYGEITDASEKHLEASLKRLLGET